MFNVYIYTAGCSRVLTCDILINETGTEHIDLWVKLFSWFKDFCKSRRISFNLGPFWCVFSVLFLVWQQGVLSRKTYSMSPFHQGSSSGLARWFDLIYKPSKNHLFLLLRFDSYHIITSLYMSVYVTDFPAGIKFKSCCPVALLYMIIPPPAPESRPQPLNQPSKSLGINVVTDDALVITQPFRGYDFDWTPKLRNHLFHLMVFLWAWPIFTRGGILWMKPSSQ